MRRILDRLIQHHLRTTIRSRLALPLGPKALPDAGHEARRGSLDRYPDRLKSDPTHQAVCFRAETVSDNCLIFDDPAFRIGPVAPDHEGLETVWKFRLENSNNCLFCSLLDPLLSSLTVIDMDPNCGTGIPHSFAHIAGKLFVDGDPPHKLAYMLDQS